MMGVLDGKLMYWWGATTTPNTIDRVGVSKETTCDVEVCTIMQVVLNRCTEYPIQHTTLGPRNKQ